MPISDTAQLSRAAAAVTKKRCSFPGGAAQAMRVAAADYERGLATRSRALSIYEELARWRLLPREKCVELSQAYEGGQLMTLDDVENRR